MMYLLFSFVAAAVSAGVVAQPGPGDAPLPQPLGEFQYGESCDQKREEPIDIMFLVDGSSSIGNIGNETLYDPSAWPGQLHFLKQLIEKSTIEGDRVGMYQFSILADDHDDLGQMEYQLGTPVDTILDTIGDMEQRTGGTPTKEAIEEAVAEFKRTEIQGEQRQRLLVIVTDGDPTCRKDAVYDGCHDPCHDLEGNPIGNFYDFNGNPTSHRGMLDTEDVKTVVIGVNNEAEKLQCLVEDPEVNIVKISDFDSFGEYRDPTGDDNLLCVNPEELELKCCRASIFSEELKNMYEQNCMKMSYIECVHRRGTVLGSCDWGIDTEGEIIEGCGVETHRPTPEPTSVPTTPAPAPTTPATAPEPQCCRAAVFTEETKGMYDTNCRKMSYVECVHRRGTILGSCEWGIDTEGNQVDGCVVETPKPTPAVTAPVTAPEPQCCRASVFTEDLKDMYDNNCRKMSYIECVHRRGTILGSCEWGVDTEGNHVDGCATQKPTSESPTAVTIPTVAPTRLTCVPLKNCVVKGGVKVFGWLNAGGRMKASSACACAERCEQEGGTEAKFHVKRKICKCWKQSTHIELKSEPFEPNRKHGGNAGGMTECVQTLNSSADVTEEKSLPTIQAATRSPTSVTTPSPTNEPTSAPTNEPTSAPTKSPTSAPTKSPTMAPVTPTSKPTHSPEECANKKQAFLQSTMATWCIWSDTRCIPICA